MVVWKICDWFGFRNRGVVFGIVVEDVVITVSVWKKNSDEKMKSNNTLDKNLKKIKTYKNNYRK